MIQLPLYVGWFIGGLAILGVIGALIIEIIELPTRDTRHHGRHRR